MTNRSNRLICQSYDGRRANLYMNNDRCIIKHWDREELEKLSTKDLLRLRYADEFVYCDGFGCCSELCEHGDKCNDIQNENTALVYSILATRPHILNKKESKELRKLRKKRGYR